MINSEDYTEIQDFSHAIKAADELAFLITSGTLYNVDITRLEKMFDACKMIRHEQTQQQFKEAYEQ